MNIGLLSYSSAAVSFLILLLLLLTSWRGRLQGSLLVAAVAVSTLWAAIAALMSGMNGAGLIGYQVLEVLRNAGWFLLLYRLLEPLKSAQEGESKSLRYFVPAVLTFYSFVLLVDVMGPPVFRIVPAALSPDVYILGHLVMALLGLALVEQVFRNTRPEQRWATKYLFLALGALFTYDFFLYSDALLFKRLDQQLWEARGFINGLAVPLLAVSAARNPQWSLDLFVSRRFVFRSAALLGAGVYLLGMAAVGYYIRVFGGTWGTAFQLAFLFLASMVLFALLFSGQMRARMRIFLSKHFFSYKYDYREEWLRLSDTLTAEEPADDLWRRAIRALGNIVDSPGGMLWKRNDLGNFNYSIHWNMNEPVAESVQADSPLVRYLTDRQWIIDLHELHTEPEVYESLHIPRWLRGLNRAWLIVPLFQKNELNGFVVLAESRAPWTMNWEDRDLLKTVGLHIANYVALLEASEALMNARQFEAFNRLSSYVVHDLKNVSAQLSMVLANAERHKDNPAFLDDAFKTVANATRKLDRMLAQLRKGGKEESAKAIVKLDDIMHEACELRSASLPVPRLQASKDLSLLIERESLVNVLAHLIQNAQEATGAGGAVELCAFPDDGDAVIEIRDDGCGMSEKFIRQHLFRPFATSKGNAGMGIGAYQSRQFVRSQGGELSVKSHQGGGTTFRIRLPLYRDVLGEAAEHGSLGAIGGVQ